MNYIIFRYSNKNTYYVIVLRDVLGFFLMKASATVVASWWYLVLGMIPDRTSWKQALWVVLVYAYCNDQATSAMPTHHKSYKLADRT